MYTSTSPVGQLALDVAGEPTGRPKRKYGRATDPEEVLDEMGEHLIGSVTEVLGRMVESRRTARSDLGASLERERALVEQVMLLRRTLARISDEINKALTATDPENDDDGRQEDRTRRPYGAAQ